MKAIAQNSFGGVEVLSIQEVEKPAPVGPHDLLVKVKAASLNPVDFKKRGGMWGSPFPQILGFDASGVVEAVGSHVRHYKKGDEVFFAGDVTKKGSHAEYTVVDERIAGKKPKSLTHQQAAGLPLTALTAWEGLFEQLKVEKGRSILVVGGAGGVGSIAIQLAKKVAGLTVVGTASRPLTVEWCKKQGADHVIDHTKDMLEQLNKLGFKGVDYVFIAGGTPDDYFDKLAALLNPLGGALFILPPSKPLDLAPFFAKRLTLTFELMFTRPMMDVEPVKQKEVLDKVSELLDNGTLTTTVTEVLPWTEFAKAHTLVESGKAHGKVVIDIAP